MAANDQFFNLGNNPNLDAADTGIDPTTGKILSNEERKSIFRNRSILSQQNRQAIARTSKMNFGGGGGALAKIFQNSQRSSESSRRVQAQSSIVPDQNLTKRVEVLETKVLRINSSLINVRKLLQKGNATDKKLLDELVAQQNLAFQNNIKKEREEELEEPEIEKELKPKLEKVEKKTVGFFEKIKKALLTLFGGIILKKVFKAFTEWQDGNKKAFKKMLIDINSALQQAVFGVRIIGRVLGGLGSLAARFARSLVSFTGRIITFPFRIAGRVIRAAVRKAFVGIKRAIGPGMRKAIKGFFNIGRTGTKVSTKVAGEVAEKVTVKAGQKLAKRGLLVSIRFIGTGLDIWGAVSEGMKGNWAGAGLYTAGAITSLIPGMQAFSGVLSVAAMGQSIHADLKRDADKLGVDVSGNNEQPDIKPKPTTDPNSVGQLTEQETIINLLQPNTKGGIKNDTTISDARNDVPLIPSHNNDNPHTLFAESTYNAYLS